MNKIKLAFAALLLTTMILLASCTANQRARNYGGTEEITINPNEKFINVAWKEDHLWIVTHDTVTDTYYAREKSSYGIMEGKLIIKK